MPRNTQHNDVRTKGYVLRRTNYGEADRILNIITPDGKMSAIAKGVRREKSKLAGGIEMFSLSEYTVHLGKSEFGVVTSAKMLRYYGNIMKNYERMELGALILKKISMASDQVDNTEYFSLVEQCFDALDRDDNVQMIEAWFLINLVRTMGEEVNLYRDTRGEKLSADCLYDWDKYESAFCENERGEYSANDIKLLRLMLTTKFSTVRKVKIPDEVVRRVLLFSRIVARM